MSGALINSSTLVHNLSGSTQLKDARAGFRTQSATERFATNVTLDKEVPVKFWKSYPPHTDQSRLGEGL